MIVVIGGMLIGGWIAYAKGRFYKGTKWGGFTLLFLAIITMAVTAYLLDHEMFPHEISFIPLLISLGMVLMGFPVLLDDDMTMRTEITPIAVGFSWAGCFLSAAGMMFLDPEYWYAPVCLVGFYGCSFYLLVWVASAAWPPKPWWRGKENTP